MAASFWFVLGTFSMTSGAVLGCLGEVFEVFDGCWDRFGLSWGGVRWLLGSFSMTSGAVLGCLGEVFDGCWDRFGLSWGRFR